MRAGLLSGNLAQVREALDAGCDPNAQIDPYGLLPLARALILPVPDRHAAVALLLDRGASPNGPLGDGKPFVQAICCADVLSARQMLDHPAHRVDLLTPDQTGWLRSTVAARCLCPDFLQSLQDRFERDTLPNRPDLSRHHLWSHATTDGQTALHTAADRPDNLMWLLNQPGMCDKQRLDARSSNGSTALALAVRAGKLESVQILLGAGACPKSALRMAAGELRFMDKKGIVPSSQNGFISRAIRLDILNQLKAVEHARKASRSIEKALSKAISLREFRQST